MGAGPASLEGQTDGAAGERPVPFSPESVTATPRVGDILLPSLLPYARCFYFRINTDIYFQRLCTLLLSGRAKNTVHK